MDLMEPMYFFLKLKLFDDTSVRRRHLVPIACFALSTSKNVRSAETVEQLPFIVEKVL